VRASKPANPTAVGPLLVKEKFSLKKKIAVTPLMTTATASLMGASAPQKKKIIATVVHLEQQVKELVKPVKKFAKMMDSGGSAKEKFYPPSMKFATAETIIVMATSMRILKKAVPRFVARLELKSALPNPEKLPNLDHAPPMIAHNPTKTTP
jgi:hypothetical protein